MNLRPSGYEPDELPDCSTPRRPGQINTSRQACSRPGQAAGQAQCWRMAWALAALVVELVDVGAVVDVDDEPFPDAVELFPELEEPGVDSCFSCDSVLCSCDRSVP